MALLLGIDTGGTYTDAVLIRDEAEVVASAKALTTRHDLAEGIGRAVGEVLAASGAAPEEITLAALSTTLATNALVEGHGGRAGLVYVGFAPRDLAAAGLAEALKGDAVVLLAGGHDHAGAEAAALDLPALERWLAGEGAAVSAYAVAAAFSTRNPAHEIAAAEAIRRATGRPVSCSHHLTAKLNGPKRALTALLNARLIGMIDHLIASAEARLAGLGVTAPLMVVRGDGALMSAAMARARPIETILSGPAASIVGARWLTREGDALVSDIGGTTTDIALLEGGRPRIDPEGARVGPYRTMVEAVAMRTTGLGGDSEVHVVSEGLEGGVTLGPRRILPVSLLAAEFPALVHETLDAQLRAPTRGEFDGRFLRAVGRDGAAAGAGLAPREAALLERLGPGAQPLGRVIRARVELGALGRLVGRGLVQVAGVTPSDAAHVLGRLDAWDAAAAGKALALMARARTGAGEALAPDARALAAMIVDRLTEQTATALLEAAFAEEGDWPLPPADLARHPLTRRGLDGHRRLARLSAGLAVPVIGLGASAPSYYGAVGARLSTRMVLPEHAGVANAIGAVVGRIAMRRSGSVTAPAEGRFRVHLSAGPRDFTDPGTAIATLEQELRAEAEAAARASGAAGVTVQVTRDIRQVRAEGRDVFLEATVTAEATGRPRVAPG